MPVAIYDTQHDKHQTQRSRTAGFQFEMKKNPDASQRFCYYDEIEEPPGVSIVTELFDQVVKVF